MVVWHKSAMLSMHTSLLHPLDPFPGFHLCRSCLCYCSKGRVICSHRVGISSLLTMHGLWILYFFCLRMSNELSLAANPLLRFPHHSSAHEWVFIRWDARSLVPPLHVTMGKPPCILPRTIANVRGGFSSKTKWYKGQRQPCKASHGGSKEYN